MFNQLLVYNKDMSKISYYAIHNTMYGLKR
jgi:hypothetical protein